jgi:hypothetical protein
MSNMSKMTKALRGKTLTVPESLKARDEMSVSFDVRQVRHVRQVS